MSESGHNDLADFGAEFDESVVYGGCPYPFYAKVRAEQPVFYSQRFDLWFVTRYDDIVRILRDPEAFSSEDRSIKPKSLPKTVADIMARKRHAKHVGNTDPPAHSRLRQILNLVFAPIRVAEYKPMIHEAANKLIDQMDRAPLDLVSRFSYPFPLTVILRLIGIPLSDLQMCMAWCREKAALDFASENMSVDEQCVAARASVEFQDYCDALVRQRCVRPTSDLISRLLAPSTAEHSPMTSQEISDLLPILIFAGHETTANLLGGLVWQLLSDRKQLEQLREDHDIIDDVVEEGLRFNSPALGFVRRATKATEVGGKRIEAGAKLFLLYGSANHDEMRWSDSEKFLLCHERSAPHLAFGLGIHFCLGAPLARLEAHVGIERLLTRFKNLRLADSQPAEWETNLVLRRLKRLPITWDD